MPPTWAHSTDWKAYLLKYKTRWAICLCYSTWMAVPKYPCCREISSHFHSIFICMQCIPPCSCINNVLQHKQCFSLWCSCDIFLWISYIHSHSSFCWAREDELPKSHVLQKPLSPPAIPALLAGEDSHVVFEGSFARSIHPSFPLLKISDAS